MGTGKGSCPLAVEPCGMNRPKDDLLLRTMRPNEWGDVAALIHASTNAWYEQKLGFSIFSGESADCEIFCRTYEALDPNCCIVIEERTTGQIVGSCFYHPRPTHIAVGIVNVHPEAFGRGIARRMIEHVIALADAQKKPLRLVSSALNLDSYSLYTRVGFVPRLLFQDMFLAIPPEGLGLPPLPQSEWVRPAVPSDVPAMVALEKEVAGIERENDYRHFLENRDGIWSASVLTNQRDGLDGFLVSVKHPASNLLGPGICRTEDGTAALLRAELDKHRGGKPVFLIPAERAGLVQRLYGWGAKNCELHVLQVRGEWSAPSGIVLPTFLPESG
jgi:GNAT superfamily N-acetyltransferase